MQAHFRLGRVLKRLMEDSGSNFHALSNEIRDANGGKRTVERRQLQKLMEGKDYSLTAKELLALDTYLLQFGEGLAERPLFEREGLLETMVKSNAIRFYVGARPRQHRHDLSPWDVRPLTKMIPSIQRVRPTVQFEIIETICSPEAKDVACGELAKLDSMGPVTVVSLGSSRASNISELLLARMLKRESHAFEWPTRSDEAPFFFIQTPDRPGFTEHVSCCSLRAEDLTKEEAKELKRRRAWAIKFGNQIRYAEFPFVDSPVDWLRRRDDEQDTIKDYGVIIAQRRKDTDQLLVVLAGLSGPGTDGAADVLLEGFPVSLLEYSPGTIVYGIVEVAIDVLDLKHGDVRKTRSAHLIHGPTTWS